MPLRHRALFVFARMLVAARARLPMPNIAALHPQVVHFVVALIVVGVFLTGLSFSGLFPTTLAYGSRLYPEQTGTLSGTLSVALTIGSMVPPLWTGVIASHWSFQVALGVNYVMVLPLIFLALYLGRLEIGQAKVVAQ